MKKLLIIFSAVSFSALTLFANLDEDLRTAAYLNDTAKIKSLLEAGADPKAQDSRALNAAVGVNNAEMVQILLEAGADAKAQNSFALSTAVEEGNQEICKLLVKAGADPSEGLIHAAGEGNIEIVKLLLEAGADPKYDNTSAFMAAVEEGRVSVVKFFIEELGADPSQLNIAEAVECVENNDLEGFILMHQSGKVDTTSREVMNAIIYSKNYDFLKYAFANFRASIQPALERNGPFALTIAINEGNTNIAELFLENGVIAKPLDEVEDEDGLETDL